MVSDWLLWQFLDTAFPAGGLAHSGGLEAAWQQGAVRGGSELAAFLRASADQLSHASIPFACAACRDAGAARALDGEYNALLSNHVANRASRAQGQAFAAAAARALGQTPLVELVDEIRAGHLYGHQPVVFGAVMGLCGLDALQTARAHLFIGVRSLISAAVRLGIVGPLEGQSIQARLAAELESHARAALEIPVHAAAQTAPLIDILQAGQDRLYSRLFIS